MVEAGMKPEQRNSILAIALFAAFGDGNKGKRARIAH